jgi:hypothetical protein
MRTGMKACVLAVAAIALVGAVAGCAAAPGGKPAGTTGSAAATDGATILSGQIQDQIAAAAKAAEGWQAKVTGIQIGVELAKLQAEIAAANTATGDARAKAAAIAAADLARLLAKVQAEAAKAPAGSAQKAGLDKLAATLDAAKNSLSKESKGTTTTPTTPAAAGAPTLVITSPSEATTLGAGDITVKIKITNFTLVSPSSTSMGPSKGYVIYKIRKTPGTAAGTMVTSDQLSNTFKGVTGGTYRVTAALVYKSGASTIPRTGQTIQIAVK